MYQEKTEEMCLGGIVIDNFMCADCVIRLGTNEYFELYVINTHGNKCAVLPIQRSLALSLNARDWMMKECRKVGAIYNFIRTDQSKYWWIQYDEISYLWVRRWSPTTVHLLINNGLLAKLHFYQRFAENTCVDGYDVIWF